MKLLLSILALLVFVLSLWADYKWRQWMKNRRETSQKPRFDPPPRD